MISSDLRVLLVASYRFGTSDYAVARSILSQKAWKAVRTALSLDYYLTVKTFPRWKNIDDTMQFAPFQTVLDITSDSSVCYQLNRSPIEDLISNDPVNFFQEELRSSRLLTFLVELLNDQDLMCLAIWVGNCNELPVFQQLHRHEAGTAIKQSLLGHFRSDFAFLIA